MEVEETLLDNKVLDIEKALRDDSVLVFGGSGRTFNSLPEGVAFADFGSGGAGAGSAVEGTRNKSLSAA